MEFLFPRRIARVSYLVRTLALGAGSSLLIDQYEQLGASRRATDGLLLVIGVVVLFAYWTGFVVAPRCRDLAMSSWMALVVLVPGIDLFFASYLAWGRTKVRAASMPVRPRERKSEGLRRLEALREEGMLTEEDFLRRKARLEHEGNL